MTLEDLVPPLELCKQIPEGKFEDSALVWIKVLEYINGSQKAVDRVMVRRIAFPCRRIPAPTLQEIIDDLTKEELCPGLEALRKANGELVYSVYASDKMKQGSAAEAALKLWLELV